MKKTIAFIILYVGSFLSQAQRLNDLGLKMIKEFTYTIQSQDGKVYKKDRFVFEYDENDRVKSLKIYDKNNYLNECYIKEGKNIYYQNSLTNHCKYDFKIDRYGNITEFEFIELKYEDLNLPLWKSRYVFNYVYDEEDKVFRLNDLENIGYNYNSTKKCFIKHDVNPKGYVVNYDGLYADKNQWKYIPDFEHPNDTNISFYSIICPNVGFGSLYIDNLLLMDWINIRSKYFPKNKKKGASEYQYEYDSKGNIMKIKEVYNKTGEILNEISIKYVDL